MPCNLFRVASVWSELARLGFRWPFPDRDLRAIEYGAGSASGACGILAGEKYAPLGLPLIGNFALVEQSKSMLDLGAKWFDTYAATQSGTAMQSAMVSRSFHRKVDLSSTWLPPSAPKFQLMVMSFFLNESGVAPDILAKQFAQNCEKHLEDEGLVIIVEPAMKLQSRRLLEFRRELLALNLAESEKNPLQILLPCLGHQKCGALSIPEDWCHEEVSWWRPPYLRGLDSMVNLDRKTLPFSYLVIQKSRRARHEILPKISADTAKQHRLVSPTHTLGRDMDFHMCGQAGKRKARMRAPVSDTDSEFSLERGDILADVDYRGEPQLTQIDRGRVIE
jgi:hypothetical protein